MIPGYLTAVPLAAIRYLHRCQDRRRRWLEGETGCRVGSGCWRPGQLVTLVGGCVPAVCYQRPESKRRVSSRDAFRRQGTAETTNLPEEATS